MKATIRYCLLVLAWFLFWGPPVEPAWAHRTNEPRDSQLALNLPHEPGELLVRFDAAFSPGKAQAFCRAHKMSVIRYLSNGTYQVAFSAQRRVADVISTLKEKSGVLYAEPNYYVSQDNQVFSPESTTIGVAKAWDVLMRSSDIIFAVVGEKDSMETPAQPGDAEQMVESGEMGVAIGTWRVQIKGLKFLSTGGSGPTVSDTVCAIRFAVQRGAKIICCDWEGAKFSMALSEAIDGAKAKGCLFLASAKNPKEWCDDVCRVQEVPLGVAEITEEGTLLSPSGDITVDVMTPAVGTYCTAPSSAFSASAGNAGAFSGFLSAALPGAKDSAQICRVQDRPAGCTITAQKTIRSPVVPDVAVMADINFDGHPELFMEDISLGGQLLISSAIPVEDCSFIRFREATAMWLGNEPGHVGLALFCDIDRDGYQDLILYKQASAVSQEPGLAVYKNNRFEQLVQNVTARISANVKNPWAIAAGDLDQDENVDLVVGFEDRVEVWRNGGEGDFELKAALDSRLAVTAGCPAGVRSLAIEDINNDGRNDIVASGNYTCVWINSGHDSFDEDWERIEHPFVATRQLIVADVDSDNAMDLLFVRQDGSLNVLVNDGKGYFLDATQSMGLDSLQHVLCAAVGDLDGDGALDVVVGRDGSPLALFNQSNQWFCQAVMGGITDDEELSTTAVAVADFDLDGDLDFLCVRRGPVSTQICSVSANAGNRKFLDPIIISE